MSHLAKMTYSYSSRPPPPCQCCFEESTWSIWHTSFGDFFVVLQHWSGGWGNKSKNQKIWDRLKYFVHDCRLQHLQAKRSKGGRIKTHQVVRCHLDVNDQLRDQQRRQFGHARNWIWKLRDESDKQFKCHLYVKQDFIHRQTTSLLWRLTDSFTSIEHNQDQIFYCLIDL